MRTILFLGLMGIAEAIRPGTWSGEYADELLFTIFWISVIMDVIELIFKIKRRK